MWVARVSSNHLQDIYMSLFSSQKHSTLALLVHSIQLHVGVLHECSEGIHLSQAGRCQQRSV